LRKYHYAFGMEYFDDPDPLVSYSSHEEAVKQVEAGLAAGKQGVTKVYRVDIPGKKEVLFGVAMKGATEKTSSWMTSYLMSEIDFKDVKSAAHLPYEILVVDRRVTPCTRAFRIAASFPDLSMMGANSFMNIMKSPPEALVADHGKRRAGLYGAGQGLSPSRAFPSAGGELRLQLFVEAGQQALALLGHDRRPVRARRSFRWRASSRLSRSRLDAGDFLAQALLFGGDVDLDLQHQAELADDLHRRVGIGQGFGRVTSESLASAAR
jgi:hypothetical protein